MRMAVWTVAVSAVRWISDNRDTVTRHIMRYEIGELVPYINWPYFYFAWQLRDHEEQTRIRIEAENILSRLDGHYRVHGIVVIDNAASDGDDIIIGDVRIPMLRQQHAAGTAGHCLCLADFVRPASSEAKDSMGVFATTVDIGLETDFESDGYMKMMTRLLADRLAEAAAERLHEQVRKNLWGYAPDECLTIEEMHAERFAGIRPAVGYPSLPDTGINFIIAGLIGMADIGIRLTESGAMKPHASVSGLIIAHPAARYFSIGKIGEDQLRDYSRRRGVPLEMMRRFLAANVD